jgi:hypothetical protein
MTKKVLQIKSFILININENGNPAVFCNSHAGMASVCPDEKDRLHAPVLKAI